jgi:hypothetical protein
VSSRVAGDALIQVAFISVGPSSNAVQKNANGSNISSGIFDSDQNFLVHRFVTSIAKKNAACVAIFITIYRDRKQRLARAFMKRHHPA